MMVCIPDWLFLIFVFSTVLQAGINFYGTFQSERISAKLSSLVSRFDELFLALQQVVFARNSTPSSRAVDPRRRRGLSSIPEGSEEITEA
ncbi:ss-ds DNA regulator [Beet curly top Iran virus]|uniref:Ss-ds DNA regulator n=1 Tax=Beet curly top Iran virus TaxID=391228 RepID=L7XB51_9GEMI|nr:ss-ds DNA regulator [Beet curly top Iran virus]AGD79155.1 ss-ds DNA regulator [Beet curly top Iran virus]AGD79160.1 ss-ds DNA regulator [Beet curly top Iran virus]AGD79180.1 ss-ds DNA regulator [Beet curly top Iran virus]AGD79185.1 ss-ds DNA regulator [Beet curly top Iran virus]